MGRNSDRRRRPRFFSWIRSDIPGVDDRQPVNNPVLVGVTRVGDSATTSRKSPERPVNDKIGIRAKKDERLDIIRKELYRTGVGSNEGRPKETLKVHVDVVGNGRIIHETDTPILTRTPRLTDKRVFTLSALNERIRKTLSLDSRKQRPKSEVSPKLESTSSQRSRPKSFFSLEAFFDSRRSNNSSVDDFCSSKYKKFELESDDSPLFKRDQTPDLLDLPFITGCPKQKANGQLQKLERHLEKIQNCSSFTSQSTLVLDNDRSTTRIAGAPSQKFVVANMDKSVDSIGSCSLDVDASTDFSDTTSGSLNILTPSSATSRIKDFTCRLHERAGNVVSVLPRTVEADDVVVPLLKRSPLHVNICSQQTQAELSCVSGAVGRLPSYLKLACSVSGYTPHTAYDPRAHANMAQPIRNSKADFLSKMTSQENSADVTDNATANPASLLFKSSYSETSITSGKITNGQSNYESYLTSKSELYTVNSKHSTNGMASYSEIRRDEDTSPSKSFIQQRVERLYGPGALAQGFFNMKRASRTRLEANGTTNSMSNGNILAEKSLNCPRLNTDRQSLDVLRQNASQKSSDSSNIENFYECLETAHVSSTTTETTVGPSLPVLRHLRPEFRAQLPISPKRSPMKTMNGAGIETIIPVSHADDFCASNGLEALRVQTEEVKRSETPKVNGLHSDAVLAGKIANLAVNEKTNPATIVKSESAVKMRRATASPSSSTSSEDSAENMDGHYFLDLKKQQTDKLLAMSEEAEGYLNSLQESEVSEEVTGMLRSAAGKARLLATQKMQQFEGLCHNNLNAKPKDAFPTTIRDLRGFWDMVMLQVKNVDDVFAAVRIAKESGWAEVPSPQRPSSSTSAAAHATNAAGARASARPTRARSAISQPNERAKLAALKREAARKIMLDARRKLARECQLAARISSAMAGTSAGAVERPANMAVEGAREVEIFVVGSKSAKSTNVEGGDFSEAGSTTAIEGPQPESDSLLDEERVTGTGPHNTSIARRSDGDVSVRGVHSADEIYPEADTICRAVGHRRNPPRNLYIGPMCRSARMCIL